VRTSQRPEHGFSLVELMIALVIASIASLGALALLGSQQRVFHSSSGERGLQETARAALSEIGTSLRRAGYGIEPSLAFDFGLHPSGDPSGAVVSCAGAGAVRCRDAIDGPDEIVFHSRSPSFSRQLAAAPTASALVLKTKLASKLQRGQILQVMCGNASRWAYVTVASTNDDLLTVNLDTSASGAFPHQQSMLTSERCLSSTWETAFVFKIERSHYFVGTYEGRPYLMLDRGLRDASNRPILEPVAPDIEDIQFAYVFPRANPQVVGVTAGTQLTNAAAGIDLGATPPAYDADANDVARTTRHPANIRAVRVSLVARTSSVNPGIPVGRDQTIPAAANRGDLTGPPGFRRLTVETSETVRNLDSRGAFIPPYSQTSGDGLNVGGG
jgi:type IV pilus assembly protein PilW